MQLWAFDIANEKAKIKRRSKDDEKSENDFFQIHAALPRF
jgi:hypothetical protein